MKRKTSLIVWGAVLLLAAYGIYDLVREVRRSYTSCYAHTYSHAIGQMMGPRFDSLTPRGEGIRIGVVDAGFGGLRDDRFTRRLRVADYLDLTDGDTTGFFRDDCDHGTRVTRNIGGFSNDTLLGLACDADVVLDLHADTEAIVHLYTETPYWPQAEVLARCLGSQVNLLAQGSGSACSFDEACSQPWWQLAERLGAPVATGYLRNDAFPAKHPLWAGPLGYQGSKAAMKLIAQADVVIALGSRMGPFGTLPQHGMDY